MNLTRKSSVQCLNCEIAQLQEKKEKIKMAAVRSIFCGQAPSVSFALCLFLESKLALDLQLKIKKYMQILQNETFTSTQYLEMI